MNDILLHWVMVVLNMRLLSFMFKVGAVGSAKNAMMSVRVRIFYWYCHTVDLALRSFSGVSN